ncbi:MAG: Gfo/Idh/MocA family oxidoreductase [Candidatus Aenigmarchaeota archaeon]|nr:Gfo/Idh/MocA family oxidoreductase [Candidatus Aenigmarchaeota archaeon]
MVIRIGFIGSGVVTQKAHVPAVIKNPRFRITAFCRRDTNKLKDLQSQFPHAKLFSDAKALINSGEIDCALIAADVDVHLSLAQMALGKELFVLLEKPVDSSSENIRKFIEKNHDKVDKIMVAFNKRFYPGIVKLDELRKSGELSDLIGGSLTFLTQHGRKPGKAGILQNMIHYCDLINWIFGTPVEVKPIFSKALNDDQKSETIASSILTEKGCAVNFFYSSSSSWKLPVHERIQVLDSKNSSFYVENADKAVFTKVAKDEVKNMIFEESNSIFFRNSSFGYEAQISAFADLIEGKASKPSPSMHDALEAHLLFEKIFEHEDYS